MTSGSNFPQEENGEDLGTPHQPPMFNIPAVIMFLSAVLILMHGVSEWLLSNEQQLDLFLALSFIPERYAGGPIAALWPGAVYWSPVTYAFLHADWGHLIMNLVWMLAFGAVVASRIGTIRFLIFFAVGAIGGAAMHYLAYPDAQVPMIGASGSVSACMGAAARFAFARGRGFSIKANANRRLNLIETFSNPQALIFVGIWFGINFLFGSGIIDIAGEGQAIAWQAHVGGFLAGLLLFGMFDRSGHRV